MLLLQSYIYISIITSHNHITSVNSHIIWWSNSEILAINTSYSDWTGNKYIIQWMNLEVVWINKEAVWTNTPHTMIEFRSVSKDIIWWRDRYKKLVGTKTSMMSLQLGIWYGSVC